MPLAGTRARVQGRTPEGNGDGPYLAQARKPFLITIKGADSGPPGAFSHTYMLLAGTGRGCKEATSTVTGSDPSGASRSSDLDYHKGHRQ